MATTFDRPGTRRAKGPIALLGLVAFLGLSFALSVQGQEKKTEKKEPPETVKPAQGEAKGAKEAKPAEGAPYRLRSAVRLGYTRPGYPTDPTKKGEAIPVSTTDYAGKIIGGTVYFMVLERVADRDRDRDFDGERNIDGAGGDAWGTGLADFNGRFVPGRNFDGGVSPRLDTRARYIYLYQLVNDRGLDPREGVVPAAYNNIRAEDVATFGLRLLVDPRYITSWGHFQGAGFTAIVKDRNQINQVRTAADGSEVKIRLAVSSNPSIDGELPQKKFTYRSPAYSLGKVGRTFEIGSDVLNLKDSFQTAYLNKGVITAAFAKNELADVEGAKEPNFVQIMYFNGTERVDAEVLPPDAAANLAANVPPDDRGGARGIFRVDWRGQNFVKLGQHSVVYGFTTDLPPVDEPIVVADPEEAMRGTGIRREILGGNGPVPLATAPREANEAPLPGGQQFTSFINPGSALRNLAQGQVGAAPGVAPGTAPTPTGGGAAATGGAMIPGGTMGGGFGGMGGIGGGFGFPGGAIGAARMPLFAGGGGTGGGTGSGNGNGTPNAAQQGQQGTKIDITNTLTNQQQQQQKQGQQQQQQQQQNQQQTGCCMGGQGVVPAPASVLLGLLGLPGVFLLRRRRQHQAA